MRFRLGMAVGFGMGYVMGAKAGRARYEQLRKMGEQFWEGPQGNKIRTLATSTVEKVQSNGIGSFLHRGETFEISERAPAMAGARSDGGAVRGGTTQGGTSTPGRGGTQGGSSTGMPAQTTGKSEKTQRPL